jgi:hypothetical protein
MLRPWRLVKDRPRVRLLGVLPFVIAFALVASGCDTLTGGGWIQSASLTLGQRASFSFTARCQTTSVNGVQMAEFYDGQFEFSDQAFDPLVQVHGDVDPWLFASEPGTCSGFKKTELNVLMTSAFQGTYRTKSQPSTQGEFIVGVADGGEPATITGDTICVSLDGPGIAYDNCGIVQGGNLQVH